MKRFSCFLSSNMYLRCCRICQKGNCQRNSRIPRFGCVRTLIFLRRDTSSDRRLHTVYNDLPHPAATYIGNKFAWRTADGSGNNVALPDMGRAGTPYSRSVQQYHAIPQDTLPDPGLVFDTLLKRDGVCCRIIPSTSDAHPDIVRGAPRGSFEPDVFVCSSGHSHVCLPFIP